MTWYLMFYGVGLIVVGTIMSRRRPNGLWWCALPLFVAIWPVFLLSEMGERSRW